jgi:hypothetical protein
MDDPTSPVQELQEPDSDQRVTQSILPTIESHSDNFRAHMSARESVPSAESLGHGQSIFRLRRDGSELQFRVILANIDNVIGIHIHLGAVGDTGPIVLPLLGNPFIDDPGLTVNGTVVEGTATATDVSGPLAGDLDALLAAMRAGDTYVNVHTTEFRPGEIRGQIR